MTFARLFPATLALALMLIFVGGDRASAFEATGNAVADAFLAGIEAAGAQTLSVDKVEANGDTVILNGLAAEMLTDGEKSSVSAGSIAFSNGVVDASGRIAADAMAAEQLSIATEDETFTAARLAGTNIRLASPDEIRDPSKASVDAFGYSGFEFVNIEIATKSEGTIPIARIASTVDGYDGNVPTSGSFLIEGIEVDPAYLDDEEAKKTLSDLGYDKLLLSMKTKGAWDVASARGTLDYLEISGDAVGRLSIAAKIGGLTRDVVDILRKPEHDDGELLGVLQKVTIESIDIRFDNDSVVERILDRQAKEADVDRAAFVERMSQSLPQILTLLNNPPFQEKVAAALGLFLNQPKNLNITAKPVQPVPIAAIVGSALAAPAAVPLLLGVDITANE